MKRFLLLSFLFLLPACGSKTEPLPPPLPEGILTLSGTILPAELSLVRRGTHVLVQDGIRLTFLESPVVTLRNYEQDTVTLRGTLEHNVDPSLLPVFVVDSIVNVESTTRDWGIRQIDLTLTTPRTWQQRNTDGDVHFFVEGVAQPILTLDEQPSTGEMPLGESIVVDGHPAVRIVNERNGNQAVYILRGTNMVTMLFTPREYPEPQLLRDEWLSVLSSVQFDTVIPPEVEHSGTGSVTDTPCGGPAGILCPAGSYCEVQNEEMDAGVCRAL
ncbi:hypothetical protein COU76_00815 [Candidatus Peregrinibacteria bacterium CG10_big_fil_rev_8_21_14_0_10_49_10]|nr:MAG: hypothetical protein COU76_00815 [Candidatus Peregrinibacteria bacterium CG10_big_fil_rev_8_21_14_0_10_49_10]